MQHYPKLLARLEAATKRHMDTIRTRIGNVYMDGSEYWVLHSCNDLGVPYFHKVNYQDCSKQDKLYTVGRWSHVDQLAR